MIRSKAFYGPAAALALLAAWPAAAQMPPPSLAAAAVEATPYLALAGEADVYEITSSQIAVMKSRNPAVREFATMLIDHHTRTTNQALAAAKAAGVMAPPPVLGTQHRGMIGQLMSARAPEFDRLYLQQQIPAHQAALALHSSYADSGDTPQLRATAQGAMPIVQRHLERAQALHSGTM